MMVILQKKFHRLSHALQTSKREVFLNAIQYHFISVILSITAEIRYELFLASIVTIIP